MSAGIITNAGRNLFAAKQGAGLPLVIDRFLLANITGLDPNAAPNPNEATPIAGDQVAELPVTTSGYIDPDKVVYSVYMGTSEGTYTFNWVGLLADDDTLVAVRYIEPLTKTKTVGGNQGNAITRNFMVAYTDAQAITNVVVEASTWQFDISAQLAQKSDTGHGHEISDINQLQTQLGQKAASDHGHEISDINQLETQLGQKAASNHGHEISDINQLETQLGQKAGSNHGHEISDINLLSSALSGKAPSGHSHGQYLEDGDNFSLGAACTSFDLDNVQRRVPWLSALKFGGAATIGAAHINHTYEVTTAGALTITASAGYDGGMIHIINTSSGNVTITLSAGTLTWLKGGSKATGVRTLLPDSACTLTRRSTSAWRIYGVGLT